MAGKGKGRNVILPKIDNGRNHEARAFKRGRSLGGVPLTGGHHSKQKIQTRSTFDPSLPLTLELKHGGQLHKVRLPTDTLDKSKKYFVTFTIDKAATAAAGLAPNNTIEESSFEEQNEDEYTTSYVIPPPQIESRT